MEEKAGVYGCMVRDNTIVIDLQSSSWSRSRRLRWRAVRGGGLRECVAMNFGGKQSSNGGKEGLAMKWRKGGKQSWRKWRNERTTSHYSSFSILTFAVIIQIK